MLDKRVKLLFNGSFSQCMHAHTVNSFAHDGEAKANILELLDMARTEANRVKTFDKMQSKLPLVIMSITDHNNQDVYFGKSFEELRLMLHREPTIYEINQYYGLTKDIRKKLMYHERIEVHTGMEISGKLYGIRVHALAFDFNEKVMALTKYTKEKYNLDNYRRDNVKLISLMVHLSGGSFVLAHPSRYVKEGKISLNDILMAAKKSRCFDAIECATSNTKLEDCFEILRFCAEHNIPVTIGSDYHYEGKKSVDGMSGQRKDMFFIESLGMRSEEFLSLVVGKSVDQLIEIEQMLKQKRDR